MYASALQYGIRQITHFYEKLHVKWLWLILSLPSIKNQNNPTLSTWRIFVREFVIKLNDKDYHDFMRISNEYGLSIEEKIYEIIDMYLIIERKRFKQETLS